MKVLGQLELAQFENLSSDPTSSNARVYWNTTAFELRVYNSNTGTWVAVLTGATATSVSGSLGSPTLITASGITPLASLDQLMFIAGSGGPVDVTTNPQISAGTAVGQKLELRGTNDTNTVLLENGNGLNLKGPWLGESGSVIGLGWDGTNWYERYRN